MKKFLDKLIVSASLEELLDENVSHVVGTKKVFLRQTDSVSNITQVAYGILKNEEQVDFHVHPTMEECFFILEGEGVYFIGELQVDLKKDIFVRIPANTQHSMKCTSRTPLRFFYFGVAIQ